MISLTDTSDCILDYLDDDRYFSNPIELVKKYVELRKKKIYVELSDLEYLISMNSIEDKLKTYYWLVKEKHKAIGQENFEYAAILRDIQNDLRNAIDIITSSNEYISAKEFLEEKKIEGIDLKFEKHFLMRVEQIGEDDYFRIMNLATDIIPGEFVNSFGMSEEYLGFLKTKYF